MCPCNSVQLSTLPCTCVLFLHWLCMQLDLSQFICVLCVCVWMKFTPSHRAAPELGEYVHVLVMCLGCHLTLCLCVVYVRSLNATTCLSHVMITWNPAFSAGRLHKVLHGKTARCQPTSECYCTALLTQRGIALWSSLFQELAVLCCESMYVQTSRTECHELHFDLKYVHMYAVRPSQCT